MAPPKHVHSLALAGGVWESLTFVGSEIVSTVAPASFTPPAIIMEVENAA